MTRFHAFLAATALTLTAAATPTLAAKKEEVAKSPALKLSKPVIEKLQAGKKLDDAGDAKGALAIYKEGEALPNLNADDRFALAQYKTNAAIKAQDMGALEEAAITRLELGREDTATQAKLNQLVASQAYNRQDYPRATKYFEAALALSPNNPELASNVAALYIRQKQYAPAYAVLKRSTDAAKAAGQPVSEDTYQRLFGIAYDGKLPETQEASTALVTAYPTPKNWRNTLLVVRDTNKIDDDGNIDLYRLMRVTGALAGERDYYEFADTLSRKGLPGEAKSVFDEGVAKGALDRNKPTTRELATAFSPQRLAQDRAGLASADRDARSAASGKAAMGAGDVNLSYDQFAPAAADYRIALQKGGVDAERANTRLGIALARSGDKAGAQAAFAAVTGPRAPIAHYWVVWTNRAS